MVSVHEHDGTVRLKAVFYEHVRRPVACDPLDEVGPHDLAAVRVVPSVVVVHTQVGTLDEAVIIGGARLEQCEQLRAAVHLCKSKTRMAPSKLHELYRWHHRRVSSKSQAASLLGCLERHLGAASLGQSAPLGRAGWPYRARSFRPSCALGRGGWWVRPGGRAPRAGGCARQRSRICLLRSTARATARAGVRR